jgi:diaminohydroxyphosphoribosylaminopyrimidine deaminase / 5-amino-6-(5-phosphoribosylamino)uracil reductase
MRYPSVMGADQPSEQFMRAALREARKGLGKTSPNPAVGAVLVANGRIIARGHHRAAGEPHAEVECLRQFRGRVPAKSALYVTLEPCSTLGRTNPCTDVIIRSGVKTIVIGAVDPNPKHQGRGLEVMKSAGINVVSGVLAEECTVLNESFNKWIVTRRPFVIAKCGMSLDGRLTRKARESRWITTQAARRHVQHLRAQVDAILVGAETVRTDNPRLTVRGRRGATQPWRVVLTRSGNLPSRARLFCDRFKERTLIYKKKSLSSVLADLGKQNITSVLIEGGGQILGQALDSALIDKMEIYVGGMLTGGPTIAFPGRGCTATSRAGHLERVSYTNLDGTVCVAGYPRFPGREAGE